MGGKGRKKREKVDIKEEKRVKVREGKKLEHWRKGKKESRKRIKNVEKLGEKKKKEKKFR